MGCQERYSFLLPWASNIAILRKQLKSHSYAQGVRCHLCHNTTATETGLSHPSGYVWVLLKCVFSSDLYGLPTCPGLLLQMAYLKTNQDIVLANWTKKGV